MFCNCFWERYVVYILKKWYNDNGIIYIENKEEKF